MRVFHKVFLVYTSLLLISCGSSQWPSELGGASNDGGEETPIGSDAELITIPVDVADQDSAAFSLAAATAFSITVEGCASGHTATATESTPTLSVYKFDQGCKAKLTSLQTNGITYDQVTGDTFTDWTVSDSAVLEDIGATNQITVTVSSTLGDPISGTEAVAYSFSAITEGTNNNISASEVSNSHAFSVDGQAAPDFTITNVSFVGMTAGGAGQFIFTLACDLAQSGATTADSCGDVVLSTIDYKLVEDTFGGTLTSGDAAAIFASNGQFVDSDLEVSATGFTSKTLTGPDQIALKPNMILLLRSGSTSYQYFNVDVSSI